MALDASTTYDTRIWVRGVKLNRPWQTNEQRLCGLALESALLSDKPDYIRQLATNNRPIFPPRFGYGPQEALGIKDIIHLDRSMVHARYDYTGSVSGYAGSERYSQQMTMGPGAFM